MQRPKQRRMRDWIAVHAIQRHGAGVHKQNTRRQYDPRDELLDYEEDEELEENIPQSCKE